MTRHSNRKLRLVITQGDADRLRCELEQIYASTTDPGVERQVMRVIRAIDAAAEVAAEEELRRTSQAIAQAARRR